MALRPAYRGKTPWYGCTAWSQTGCKGSHGAHPDGTPKGFPADAATRQARVAAHAAFDAMWRGRNMRRTDAYGWMQQVMGLTKDAAHIAEFDASQCAELIRHVEASLLQEQKP